MPLLYSAIVAKLRTAAGDGPDRLLSVDELVALHADPEALERPVTAGDSPLTTVGLDDAGKRADRPLPPLPPGLGRVVVGYARRPPVSPAVADAFDVLVTDGDDQPSGWARTDDARRTLANLGATCAAQPLAAVALAQVLRVGSRLSVEEALVAESCTYSTLLGGPEFAWWQRQHQRPRRRLSTDPVLTSVDGTTMTVTLNRPETRNAYSATMRDSLVDALRGAAVAGLRVILRGNGPAFCSGGDLAEFGTTADPATAHAVRIARSPGLLLHRLGAATTAYVHGPCVGAGTELPAFCARVVATPATTFRLPELAMGLLPGAGGTASLPRRIGRHRAAFLALSGAPLTAAGALHWGLVDDVSDPG
jgi:hypothetical protein